MCYFSLWKHNNIKYLEGILQQARSHEYAAEPLAMQCETNRQKSQTTGRKTGEAQTNQMPFMLLWTLTFIQSK